MLPLEAIAGGTENCPELTGMKLRVEVTTDQTADGVPATLTRMAWYYEVKISQVLDVPSMDQQLMCSARCSARAGIRSLVESLLA